MLSSLEAVWRASCSTTGSPDLAPQPLWPPIFSLCPPNKCRFVIHLANHGIKNINRGCYPWSPPVEHLVQTLAVSLLSNMLTVKGERLDRWGIVPASLIPWRCAQSLMAQRSTILEKPFADGEGACNLYLLCVCLCNRVLNVALKTIKTGTHRSIRGEGGDWQVESLLGQ